MSTLQELIARVEAASGPDREIDARIYLYCSDARNEFVADDGAGVRYKDFERQGRHLSWDRVPNYSRSVDAVTTLIMGANLSWDWWVNSSGKAGIRFDDYEAGVAGDGSTPALALVAALLRALAGDAP